MSKCIPHINMQHYSVVIISAMASHITSVSTVCSTVWSGTLRRQSSKFCLTGLCEGNSPVRASNAENISIWWRHHEKRIRTIKLDSEHVDIGIIFQCQQLYSLPTKIPWNTVYTSIYASPPRQNGHYFAGDMFSWMKILEFRLTFHWHLWGIVGNKSTSARVMAWRRTGGNEPMLPS